MRWGKADENLVCECAVPIRWASYKAAGLGPFLRESLTPWSWWSSLCNSWQLNLIKFIGVTKAILLVNYFRNASGAQEKLSNRWVGCKGVKRVLFHSAVFQSCLRSSVLSPFSFISGSPTSLDLPSPKLLGNRLPPWRAASTPHGTACGLGGAAQSSASIELPGMHATCSYRAAAHILFIDA